MKMRKTIALIASFTLLASVFSGCKNAPATSGTTSSGSSAASAGGNVTTINYYGGWTGANLERMNKLVTEFNGSQQAVKVNFTSQQWTAMFTKFLADYQAGSSPDVVAMHTFELGQFVKMGVLDSEAIKSMNLKEADYIKTAWQGSTYGGTSYGVPLDVNMHALYYNKDLFKKANIAKAPSSKGEFIAAAQKLTIDANGKTAAENGFDAKNVKQYGFGFLMNHHAFYQMYSLMNQMGYNPFTSDMTKITLDTKKSAPAVQYMEDLIFKYKVVPNGEKSPIDDFKAGKVAMVIDGNWQLSGFSSVKFDWDTAEYPLIFQQKAVWGASELLALPKSKDAAKQKAAQTFIKWLSDNSAKWAESGKIPANLAAQKAATKLKGIDAYNAELGYVKFLPANPKSVKLFSSATPSPILTAAQSATLNNKNANDIIKQLETDMNKVLAS
ncbi:MAG TPA: extracellular solute-binding protein [Oscillospiraceae bacterium]|nr:extracellular solute-binding protein [Oscillospiraceae bacterium]